MFSDLGKSRKRLTFSIAVTTNFDLHYLLIQLCKKERKTRIEAETKDRCQNWKPGFNWYCSTVIILKGIVWSNTCNVSTHNSFSYRIIGLSFCIEQYIQCEINTFTQMDIIVVAHLYDTHHKNIQVIVAFFFFSIYWCEAHLKSTDMVLITRQGPHSNSSPSHRGLLFFTRICCLLAHSHVRPAESAAANVMF